MFPLLDSNTFNVRCISALNSLNKKELMKVALRLKRNFMSHAVWTIIQISKNTLFHNSNLTWF